MWISLAIGERVVLPMAGHPFLRDDRRGQPKPEPHGQRREIMQPNTSMRLRAMEKKRYADIGYVARDNDENDRHPPSCRQFPEPWHP
jgi:hypothetical protein